MPQTKKKTEDQKEIVANLGEPLYEWEIWLTFRATNVKLKHHYTEKGLREFLIKTGHDGYCASSGSKVIHYGPEEYVSASAEITGVVT